MRVIVCGGRTFSDKDFLWAVLDQMHSGSNPISAVLHGAAHGADELAAQWADARGIYQQGYEADWSTKTKWAGPLRNRLMLSYGFPDLVIAFPGGKGTADMVRQARKRGVEVMQFSRDVQ